MALAATLQDKRGPRIGDAASLWNFTPAPGWNKEEVQILRLCLMKYGVGQWLTILNTGLLPGKLIQQLNGQTQRLLGQQSLAAFTGLKVDIDRIRTDNEARTDVSRKTGLIIYEGPILTKEMKMQLKEEAERKYGLTDEQSAEVEAALEALAANTNKVGTEGLMTKVTQAPVVDLMNSNPEEMTREMKLQLLKRLRAKLVYLVQRHRAKLGLPPRPGPEKATAAAAAAAGKEDAMDADTDPDNGKENNAAAANQLPAQATTAKPAKASKPRAPSAGGGQRGPKAATNAVKEGGVKKRAAPRKKKSEAAEVGLAQELLGSAGTAGAPGAGAGGAEGGSGSGTAAAPEAGVRDGSVMEDPAGGAGWPGMAEEDDDDDFVPTTTAAVAKPAKKATQKQAGGKEGKAPRSRASKAAKAVVDDNDDGAFDASDVATLTAMGFSPRKARAALAECGFDVEAAVEWLFGHCV